MYHCHLLHHEDDGMMGSFTVIDTTATGISETNIDEPDFKFYPNPVSGTINIKIPENVSSTDIKIINTLGQTFTYIANPKNALTTVDVSGLKNGLYFTNYHYFGRFGSANPDKKIHQTMRYFLLIILVFTGFYVHGQSQVIWNNTIDIADASYHNLHPRMCLDRKGNPLVIWGSMDEAVMFTRWTGTSFTTPVKLNSENLTVATASWMGPDIASNGDTVYVVLRQTPETTDTSKHIFILTSFNGGQTFSKPVQVDFIGDSLSRFPTVTVDEKGNPIVAFMKFNKSFLQSKLVVARSNDF